LSFLLLFGAGLFVRSLQNLQTTDTGVALDNLVTFRLSPALNGYDSPRAVNFYRAARAAGIGGRSPPGRRRWRRMGQLHEGHRPADGENMQAFMNACRRATSRR
jgi:hypothetical protein